MLVYRKRKIEELEAKTDHLHERLDNLRDSVQELRDSVQEPSDDLKDYIRQCVWESMQSWVNSGHQNIITMLEGKVVETRYVRDELAELNKKKRDLESVLEHVNKVLAKCREK